MGVVIVLGWGVWAALGALAVCIVGAALVGERDARRQRIEEERRHGGS